MTDFYLSLSNIKHIQNTKVIVSEIFGYTFILWKAQLYNTLVAATWDESWHAPT